MGVIMDTILKSRVDKGYNDIEIVLKNHKEIFNQCDYNLVKVNRLNRELENHIYYSVKKHSLNKKTRLIIHIIREELDFNDNSIRKAIHGNFSYKVEETHRHLINQFIQWIINMIIGVLFLVLCFILREIVERFSYIKILKIMKESLSIVGWVALWEPISFILFGWKSINKDKLLYKKLSTIPIIIIKD